MNLVREILYEKFVEYSDPIDDLCIGIHGTVYRCGECGIITDIDGDEPDDKELERSEIILHKYGDKYTKDTWCRGCEHNARMRDEQERFEYEEEQRQREEEEEREREEYYGRYR